MLPPILQIGDVLLSSDIITEEFCCDLSVCHGACCIEGDAGAPVGHCCLCALEKAHREGRCPFCKPISCALYPIREKQFSDGSIGLNYHRWDICACGREKGRQLHLKVYQFLREPLVRRFGQQWYDELCDVARALQA